MGEIIQSSSDVKQTNTDYNLIEDCLNNSSSSSSSSDDEKDISNKLRNLEHFCSYFQSDSSSHSQLKCSHVHSLTQTVCLKCDHEKVLEDSLNYMAFVSPTKSESPLKIDLKFESPTYLEEVTPIEENLILDETLVIDESLNSTLQENETCLSETTSQNKTLEQSSYAESQSSFGQSLSASFSLSMSESIMWSDSESNDSCTQHKSFFLAEKIMHQENREELKRKNAIEMNEKKVLKNEIDMINLQRNQYFSPNKKLKKYEIIKKLETGEKWYCPMYDPPLPSDLNDTILVNNAPIIQYYKKNKKFQVVS